jgi:hypothetical protein
MATPARSSLDTAEYLEPKVDVQPPTTSPDSISEKSEEPVEKFKPGWRFMLAFASLAVITLMAALDATSISVALPVSIERRHQRERSLT